MAKLTEQVRADLTESMKARDAARTAVLRLLQSALKNEQIEKGHELSDEEALAVIRRGVKQRQDLVDNERREMELLQTYLPQQISDEEVETIVRETIAAIGASSKKDSGKVMKEVMAKHKGVVDGKKVQEIVGRLLP
jgi:uncharacterized protein